jgi:hypothetical protein
MYVYPDHSEWNVQCGHYEYAYEISLHKTKQTTATSTPLQQSMNPQETTHKIMGFISGYWISRSIHAIVSLGIPDLFDSDNMQQQLTVEYLAEQSNTHTDSLYRLMRALTGVGVFKEVSHRLFELEPLGRALQKTAAFNARDSILTLLGDEHFRGWTELEYSVQTGNNGVGKLYGMTKWDYYAQNPERATLFNNTMSTVSSGLVDSIVSAYDFKPYKVITDVGGGQGSLLKAVLNTAPDSTGIVYDLPHVVEESKNIEDPELHRRIEFQSGSFFDAVPEGADLYMMKAIIHDWNDEKSTIILKNIRRAMKDTSRLLIIDSVIVEGNEFTRAKYSDRHIPDFLKD